MQLALMENILNFSHICGKEEAILTTERPRTIN